MQRVQNHEQARPQDEIQLAPGSNVETGVISTGEHQQSQPEMKITTIVEPQTNMPPPAHLPAPEKTPPTVPATTENIIVDEPAPKMNMNPTITQLADPKRVTPLDQLGDEPQWIDCHFCKRRTKTKVEKEGDTMQCIAGLVLCMICVCLAPLPCIQGWFTNTSWSCASCRHKVAYRPHDGQIETFEPPKDGANTVPTVYPEAEVPAPVKQA
ncbi:Fc.00g057650.m01.CDS01 [Cosmosporella sp. VM-42]